jgi:Uma2 family endonuclease
LPDPAQIIAERLREAFSAGAEQGGRLQEPKCRGRLDDEVANAWPPILESDNAQVGRALSLEEWLSLDEDEEGELIDGRLVEEEVSDFTHELTVSWLIRVVGLWLGGRGFVVGSELKILTSSTRGRKPDLAVILPGSKAPPRTGPLRDPPDILVEVVTPTPRDERRDRVEKMSEYARFGVPYYWLVDPTLGAFEIFERTPAGNYQKLVGVTSGRIDPVPGCAGLVVDVDALWAELARLQDE